MGNLASRSNEGFKCPVKNCPHSKNRFYSKMGLFMHLVGSHVGYFEKALKLQKHRRSDYE